MEFYSQLSKFLEQAETDNLKTRDYISQYLGLQVKVSFGQGHPAKIPWISFLKPPNKTSKGIYPVYLYYKKYGVLILAYGVSETKKPDVTWGDINSKTIREYFNANYQDQPARYGDSYIYKIYEVQNFPNKREIEEDLNKLIETYLKHLDSTTIRSGAILSYIEFHNDLGNTGLIFSKKITLRFIASLLTKPFVILTGLSGSGKTKIAQAFVQWICNDKNQYKIIPVGADWTNREPLLGYPNALNTKDYVRPDNGVLDLLIQATKGGNQDKPFFLILDEMNLSHVERYFADFLSAMESNEPIPLHSKNVEISGIPSELHLSPNIFIIGTVNIDETTHMFSPKVLDRANTIEFRVTEEEMNAFLNNTRGIDLQVLESKGAQMASSFLQMSKRKGNASIEEIDIKQPLIKFFRELKKTGAEYGYRSAYEIQILINKLTELDYQISMNEKLDIAIMQKILPKLHGSRRKLCPVLETLANLCVSSDVKIVREVFENEDFDFNGSNVHFPLSLEKITRMYRGAIDNGFASFAEA